METRRQLLIVLIGLLLLIFLGAVGFKYFGGEELSWIDSFYHAILTVSSIGYTDEGFAVNQAQKFYGLLFMGLS